MAIMRQYWNPSGLSRTLLLCGILVSVNGTGWAEPFAGITSLSVQGIADGSTIMLDVQSDLPVDYTVTVLDTDHVSVKFKDSRLASGLANESGQLKIPLAAGIDRVMVVPQSGNPKGSRANRDEEIIIKGPNIGLKAIQVRGGEIAAKTVSPRVGAPVGKEQTNLPTDNVLTLLAMDSTPDMASTQNLRGGMPTQPTANVSTSLVSQNRQQADVTSDTSSPARSPYLISAYPKAVSGPQITEVITADSARTRQAPRIIMGQPPSTLPQMEQQARGQEGVVQTQTKTTTVTTHAKEDPADGPYAMSAQVAHAPAKTLPQSSMTRPTQSTNITNGSTSLNPALKSVLSLYQDGQYEQALAKLNTMEKTADPAALAAAKAEIYMAMDKLDLAVAGFRQAYQAQPDRYAERYAVALLRSNNPDDALDILQKASARQPNNANIAWLIGCIYQQVGLPNQGIPYLKKAIALNPKSGDLAFTLGLAYELQGDPMTAKNHYAQAVTLNPSDSEAKQSLERVKSMAKLGTATQ